MHQVHNLPRSNAGMYGLSVPKAQGFQAAFPKWKLMPSPLDLGFVLTQRKQVSLRFHFVNVRFDTDP